MLNLVSRWVNRNREKSAIFIVGCQRSGTTMLLKVLARSSACRVYGESNNSAAFDYYRLRSDETVKQLIEKTPAPTIVFKPLLDSQRSDRLLQLHPNAKAIWIYRDYRNVAASSVKKWQDGQKDIMCGIAANAPRDAKHHQHAISEGMSRETMALVRRLCSPSISAEEGAAVLWYARNLLYFDLGLEKDSRVLLVRYEDLVAEPQRYFQRVFEFLGCDFKQAYARDVFDSSAKKPQMSMLSNEVELLCAQMMNRLNHQYAAPLHSLGSSIQEKVQASYA